MVDLGLARSPADHDVTKGFASYSLAFGGGKAIEAEFRAVVRGFLPRRTFAIGVRGIISSNPWSSRAAIVRLARFDFVIFCVYERGDIGWISYASCDEDNEFGTDAGKLHHVKQQRSIISGVTNEEVVHREFALRS